MLWRGQYPEIALPTVVVRASYPGATAETIAETVATPLEQEVNGVENMLYMESQSTSDGVMTLTVTFALGTDIDEAQVLVQNRVARSEPRLPAEVRQSGVVTQKTSPEMLLVVHLISPDASRDQLYIANYAYLQIRDVLARINGVGDLQVFGGAEYSMRVWLDIERLASLDLTAGDIVTALREQNVQVAAGKIGEPPQEQPGDFQLTISSLGRLQTAEEFDQVVVKRGADGRLTRLSDVARIELGAQDYMSEGLAMMFEARGVHDSRSYDRGDSRLNRYRLTDFQRDVAPNEPLGPIARFIASDQAFDRTPLLAYAEAWALTFFLCETRPQDYADYLATTASRPLFSDYPADERVADFRNAFGDDLDLLNSHFLSYMKELR